MAYVVRAIDLEGQERVKVFRALPDAREIFAVANSLVTEGEREAAYLYEAPGEEDARAAIEAVKVGKAVILDRSRTKKEWLELAERLGI